MIDAYCHLDMSAKHPIADFERRMDAAGIDHALIVETWNGNNRDCLRQLIASPSPRFRIAPCFRPEGEQCGAEFLSSEIVRALRVRTADLHRLGAVAAELESKGKWLLPHAESGIGVLTKELNRIAALHPELLTYLPHMGWPRRDQQDDHDWRESISELSKLSNLIVGISAIAHFSREPFPHNDVAQFVVHLLAAFGAESLVAASDYPLFEKDRYVRYMQLAASWIAKDGSCGLRFESSVFGDRPAG